MVRKRKIFPLKVIVQLALIPVLIVLVAMLYMFGVHSTVSAPVEFMVVRGDSVTGVANRLMREGLIDSTEVFKAAISMNGGQVQRGLYDIPRGASTWNIANMLATGQVATVNIVIPEGLTVKQIKNQLLGSSALTGAVECDAGNDMPVCNLRDGQLFPDTYRVAKGSSRLALLEFARKKMVAVEDSIKNSVKKLPKPLKDWGQVITLASIVQKETPVAREMPVVASVYLNRLNKGMRLQADPTVVYVLTEGLGDMQGAPLLSGHLKIESPYNTYRNAGLPPAPIANVGVAAIRAVLNPADTNYLFFVADGRGGHKFSHDYETHMKNHANWRKIKKARNKD
ncbi:MAG: endolytic transglycosylase MltG [Alphaproteobacteria bacterium]|nr:endolytic transglycosylase MltG [Alphaproteobacteria bacterium]